MTKNFDYLRPLSIAADEEMANAMAEVIYGAVAEERAKRSDLQFRQSVSAKPRRRAAHAAGSRVLGAVRS